MSLNLGSRKLRLTRTDGPRWRAKFGESASATVR
jgi:hypothetical protein